MTKLNIQKLIKDRLMRHKIFMAHLLLLKSRLGTAIAGPTNE